MKDPESAYNHAAEVIKGRWPEAEPYIKQDPYYAYLYALHIIEHRWPEAEPTIKQHPVIKRWYMLDVVEQPIVPPNRLKTKPQESPDYVARPPKPYIKEDPQWAEATNYAVKITKGRSPEAEPYIKQIWTQLKQWPEPTEEPTEEPYAFTIILMAMSIIIWLGMAIGSSII